MRQEIKILFAAIMAYTRIPCGSLAGNLPEQYAKSTYYLPLVGWIVGGISATLFIGFNFILPLTPSIILSMLAGILITGAFHEDGLADTCDAFGGGWEKEKILTIMKDSRIGTFGTVGLIFILLLKLAVLSELLGTLGTPNLTVFLSVFAVFVSAHSASRFAAITAITTHNYARQNDESSKSKSLINRDLNKISLRFILSGILGLIPFLLFKSLAVFLLIIPIYLTKIFMMRFFEKWIDGYTGDCLGAIQQVCEIVFYLGLLAIWKFI